MHYDSVRKKWTVPLPGQRIFRSMVAVVLCMLIYEVRGRQGLPIYALIAALQCIQPYTKNIKAVARRRMLGTIIGAAWALAVLLLERQMMGVDDPAGILHYLVAGLGTGIVIYFTVLLRVPDMAQFSAIVFLIIVITHTDDSSVYLYAFHRTLETLIGILVGELVNRVHLPRIRNTDTIYASGITDTIFEEGHRLSGYSQVELNRLIDDGCNFTVSTIQTPATVRELLPEIHFPLPIIAMDGAVLYDMQTREFLHTIFLTPEQARNVYDFLNAEGVEYFANTLEHHTLVVRHGKMRNAAIRRLYEQKRPSPYRNFAPQNGEHFDSTIYFLVLDEKEKILHAMERFRQQPWSKEFRIVYDHGKSTEEYICARIFRKDSTKEAMMEELKARTGIEKVVTFGSIPGRYDVYVRDANKDIMVKELKRRFEPVSLKGWKNIIR